MMARVRHGWTTAENGDSYEQLRRQTIFPRIAARGAAGYRGIKLLRRSLPAGEEFVAVMWFELVAGLCSEAVR
ncbi:MAG TPA: hypothetical protein VJU18_05800 [Vicinamibacteria bacterium]|nr:hypothetical protein [Vicinamibacteria bacterium]